VKALDADGGLNGRLRYSLGDDDDEVWPDTPGGSTGRRYILGDDVSSSLIYVDERTGVLRLSAPLDRETTARAKFTVWAADSAAEPKSASAQVRTPLATAPQIVARPPMNLAAYS